MRHLSVKFCHMSKSMYGYVCMYVWVFQFCNTAFLDRNEMYRLLYTQSIYLAMILIPIAYTVRSG